jgi:hypothetical protein
MVSYAVATAVLGVRKKKNSGATKATITETILQPFKGTKMLCFTFVSDSKAPPETNSTGFIHNRFFLQSRLLFFKMRGSKKKPQYSFFYSQETRLKNAFREPVSIFYKLRLSALGYSK